MKVDFYDLVAKKAVAAFCSLASFAIKKVKNVLNVQV
jgi:hypothetical protein